MTDRRPRTSFPRPTDEDKGYDPFDVLLDLPLPHNAEPIRWLARILPPGESDLSKQRDSFVLDAKEDYSPDSVEKAFQEAKRRWLKMQSATQPRP